VLRRIRDWSSAQERCAIGSEIAAATIAQDFELWASPTRFGRRFWLTSLPFGKILVDQVDLIKAPPQPESPEASDPPSPPFPATEAQDSPFDRYRINVWWITAIWPARRWCWRSTHL